MIMERSANKRVLASMALGLLLMALGHGDLAGAQSSDEILITLDADSTSVTEVLRILADRSRLNIVTSPEVMGRTISIHLRNTPFDEALNLVVRAAGLGYERVGNSILVADIQGLDRPTGLITRVYSLQYANASEVAKMLEVVTRNVSANIVGDQLVVRATQSALEQIDEILSYLDQKPLQVLLTARLIEVNTSALLELGIDWEALTDWSTVIVEGDFSPTAQGEIPRELGPIELDHSLDYFRQVNAFEVALDALVTDGTARLLAATKIVAQNGQAAEIFAGETVPVVITSLQSPGAGGGVFQTVQLEKIDVGVRLNITPRVSEEGFITALVQPEVSRIIRFVGPDSDLPQTSTRRANTLVRVHDGEKIYMGGLLSDEERVTIQSVPLLGKIPLLGYLFQHRVVEHVRTDLVIEITPQVIGDTGAALPTIPPDQLERLLEETGQEVSPASQAAPAQSQAATHSPQDSGGRGDSER